MASLPIFPQTPPEIMRRLAPLPVEPQGEAPTFALYTLGCKVNQYDSHQIARMLLRQGFRRVEFREQADLYVIDTCTVTNEADRKSRKAAARAHRNNPRALVAVTGCAATYAQDQFRLVAPDALVLPNARKWELPDLAIARLQQTRSWARRDFREDGAEPLPGATRERAVVKIQDGCNHQCAFCIIPTVRGASRLKARDEIIAEARAFVREGARELVVTGVSMGDFSKARGTRHEARGNGALCDLLRALATIEGLERIRVSSIDVADVDEAFLQLVATHPKICPHLHLALQGGTTSLLRRMRRRYTPEMFGRVARRWRELRPDGGLTTDIIVGFPGETRQEFEGALQLAREVKFSAIHVFPYSPRQGTHAATLPDHVAPGEQKARVAELLALADQLTRDYAEQFIGQTLPVLLESSSQFPVGEGATPHYLKARVEGVPEGLGPGDMVWFRAEQWDGGALRGEVVV